MIFATSNFQRAQGLPWFAWRPVVLIGGRKAWWHWVAYRHLPGDPKFVYMPWEKFVEHGMRRARDNAVWADAFDWYHAEENLNAE